jgi:hypothetical protein
MGMTIGVQYRHEFLMRLLRLLLASLVTVPFALVMLALLAALYSVILGLPVTTLVLALAPAGIRDGAHRQGARPRRRADHRFPDRAHRHDHGARGMDRAVARAMGGALGLIDAPAPRSASEPTPELISNRRTRQLARF